MMLIINIFIAVILFLSGCGPKNAVSNDSMLDKNAHETPTPLPSPDLNLSGFSAVKGILIKRCISCHTAFANYAEKDFIEQGYIIPGSVNNSLLIQKLKGANTGSAIVEEMPKGQEPLTQEELAQFKNWVAHIPPSVGKMTASERTVKALSVINDYCINCHLSPQTASGNGTNFPGTNVPAFANFNSDSQFAINGLVLPGNATGSWFFKALKGYGDLNLMPLNSVPIPVDAAASIEKWINEMNNP